MHRATSHPTFNVASIRLARTTKSPSDFYDMEQRREPIRTTHLEQVGTTRHAKRETKQPALARYTVEIPTHELNRAFQTREEEADQRRTPRHTDGYSTPTITPDIFSLTVECRHLPACLRPGP